MSEAEKALSDINFEPTSDRLLIRPPSEEERHGLIWIPSTAKRELPETGVVVKTGPGILDEDRVLHPVAIEPGTVVFFGRHAGYAINVGDEQFMIIRELDVFGTSKGADEE